MDPRLFHVDWTQLAEVMTAVVILAFIVERALSIVFENQYFQRFLDQYHIKELVAFALSFLVCYRWHFDLISVVMNAEATSTVGTAVTAAVVAGGSKASLKLFQEILNIKNDPPQPAPAGAKTGEK